MHRFLTLFYQWRYLFLLVALLALLVFQPLTSGFGTGEWLFDALLSIVIVMLALSLAQDKIWRVVAVAVCFPAVALSIGSHFLSSTAHDASLSAGHAIGALFFVAVTVKIVRSIFTSQDLSLDSVFGAICGYLLLGVAWGLAYTMMYAANPESFQIGDAIKPQLEQGDSSRYVFIYYSFVTLTTVGNGDITPLSIPARTLSWIEAVTGQLYLAVLIAGLISALVTKHTVRNRPQ